MAEDSAAAAVGKLSLGIGVGFGLYLLIRNLGFGGGGGFGGDGRGEDRGEASSPPRDGQRIVFLMVGPTTTSADRAVFKGPGDQLFSLDEMITRIKAGGRTDVSLRVRGDVIHGVVSAARSQLKAAGIVVWELEPGGGRAAASVGRGHYR